MITWGYPPGYGLVTAEMDGYCRSFQTSLAQMWTKMWTKNAHRPIKCLFINNLWDFCGGDEGKL